MNHVIQQIKQLCYECTAKQTGAGTSLHWPPAGQTGTLQGHWNEEIEGAPHCFLLHCSVVCSVLLLATKLAGCVSGWHGAASVQYFMLFVDMAGGRGVQRGSFSSVGREDKEIWTHNHEPQSQQEARERHALRMCVTFISAASLIITSSLTVTFHTNCL